METKGIIGRVFGGKVFFESKGFTEETVFRVLEKVRIKKSDMLIVELLDVPPEVPNIDLIDPKDLINCIIDFPIKKVVPAVKPKTVKKKSGIKQGR